MAGRERRLPRRGILRVWASPMCMPDRVSFPLRAWDSSLWPPCRYIVSWTVFVLVRPDLYGKREQRMKCNALFFRNEYQLDSIWVWIFERLDCRALCCHDLLIAASATYTMHSHLCQPSVRENEEIVCFATALRAAAALADSPEKQSTGYAAHPREPGCGSCVHGYKALPKRRII